MRLPVLAAMLVAAVATRAVAAEQPIVLIHTGYLLDSADTPVGEPQQKLTFRVFDQNAPVTTETKVWEGSCTTAVERGHYTVALGGSCGTNLLPSHLPTNKARYLEISVGTTVMLPRMAFGTVPTAAVASNALLLAGQALTDLDNRYAKLEQDVSAPQAGSLAVDGILAAAHVAAKTDVTAPSITATDTLNAGTVAATGGVSAASVTATGALNAGTVVATGGLSAASVTATGATTTGSLDVTSGAKLHGGASVDGSNVVEFGAGVEGKQIDAGKIGYQVWTADALDIVGAGTTGANRKITFWNEGGATFAGTVAAPAFTGDGSGLTALNAANLASGSIPDARLSANVPFLNTTANQRFQGGLSATTLEASGTITGQTLTSTGAVNAASVAATGAVTGASVAATGAINGASLSISGGSALHAGAGIDGKAFLEFGVGVAGKETNAGRIGYGTFSNGASLDIVGAGTTGTNRKITFWNEGGATFNGAVAATGGVSAGADLTATGKVAAGTGVTVGGYQVFDGSGVLNQAAGDRYAELRVITNTTGPDKNIYLNYPVRAGSATHVYNDTDVTGALSVSGGLSVTKSGIAPCCSTFTASLNENTAASGIPATLQFHDSGLVEAQFSLVSANTRPPGAVGLPASPAFNRRGLLASSVQDKTNLIATGGLGSFDTTTGFMLGSGGTPDNWARLTKTMSGATSGYHDLAVGAFWANGATRFDIAEFTPVDPADDLEAGDVVSVDKSHDVRLSRTRRAYDPSVVGVVSSSKTASMVIGGDTRPEQMDTVKDKKPVALGGRVPVKVTLEGGPIHRGDLLAASSTPGCAMRAADTSRGGIIGTALSEFVAGERGTVTVFVHLQPAPDGSHELRARLDEAEQQNAQLRGEVAELRQTLTGEVEELRSRLAARPAPSDGTQVARSR